jgi:hypothetical protein
MRAGEGYYRRHGFSRPEPSQSSGRLRVTGQPHQAYWAEFVRDWPQSGKPATFALGEGYLIVDLDGDTCSYGIPWELSYTLTMGLGPVDYVALAPDDDRYFVQVRGRVPHTKALWCIGTEARSWL